MAGKDTIQLIILTPKGKLVEAKVSKVELPGEKGRFMVLHDHAEIISALVEGNVAYASSGEGFVQEIKGGFVEVSNNKVTVCAVI